MSSRKYGYVVVIHKKVGDENKLFAVCEALKISPYQITTGYKAYLDTFSDEVSPSKIPEFIKEMGEPDSFSFLKFTDVTSVDLMGAEVDSTFEGFGSLAVISLSNVPKKLTGRTRLSYIFNNAEAYIDLSACMVFTAWTNIKGSHNAPMDIITLAGILINT